VLFLTISTNNPAFAEDHWHTECARILRACADQLERDRPPEGEFYLYDINKNMVGTCEVEPDLE